MASYSYTRDLTEDDLAQKEIHVYTKKELWENWWDYNLKWVLIGIGGFALLVYFLLDAFVFTVDIDYQIAIVAPVTISDSVLEEMSETLSPYLEDVTGDGVVTLTVSSYLVDLSTYTSVTDVTGETEEVVEEVVEEEVAEDTDEGYTYFTIDTSTYDYYMEVAGQVQLSSDLQLGESVIYILADPYSFLLSSDLLCYPDGTLAEDSTTADWTEMVYEITECSIFSDTVLEALEGFYIGRRGGDDDFAAQFELHQTLWDTILDDDAVTYSETLS